ncbi:MAG: acylphosphatase [Lachnospiraceae bacterium]|nr:acylphosphatase [Lachnospiraceae bacterium]
MSDDIVRKKIIFKGEVQFVGFRFQSKYLADSLGLTGYVENLPNGDVLMEVQGRERTIEDLVICLHQRKPIRIDSMEEEYLSLKQNEKGFRYMW